MWCEMLNNVPNLLISIAVFLIHFPFGFYRVRYKKIQPPVEPMPLHPHCAKYRRAAICSQLGVANLDGLPLDSNAVGTSHRWILGFAAQPAAY